MIFRTYRTPLLALLFVYIPFSMAAPPPGKGPNKGDNDGDGTPELLQCSYPSFSDSPKDKLRGSDANFLIQYGDQINQFNEFDLVFNENGDGPSIKTGMINPADYRWFVENMFDNQHRTGNNGIDAMGQICNDLPLPCSPKGKRWSAWYTEGDLAQWTDGYLSLGGRRDTTYDFTRPGAGEWYENKLYTTWLSTFQREYDEGEGATFGSMKKGSQTFKPPMYLKSEVSFEQMQTPGFRLSMWLMPVEKPADLLIKPSIAYDGNPKNGFEMDIFEFEPTSVIRDPDTDVIEKVCGNNIEFSWINAFYEGRGKTPAGTDGKNNFEGIEEGYCSDGNCSDTFANPVPPNPADPSNLIRPDINEGTHTVEFLWTENEVVWAFNGEIVLEITDPSMIPEREHYLIVSREMTNGVSGGESLYDGGLFFLPPEGGLYGWNGNSNVGDHFDLVNHDKALIDYIKIYEK